MNAWVKIVLDVNIDVDMNCPITMHASSSSVKIVLILLNVVFAIYILLKVHAIYFHVFIQRNIIKIEMKR